MRLLFEMVNCDFYDNGNSFIRPSARSIIVKNHKVAMVYSKKYNYYKFPGGGIEKNESSDAALIRETREEAGLVIIPCSIREFGYVRRIEKSYMQDIDYFVQDSFYYFAECEEKSVKQSLCDYESDEGFTLTWVTPDEAITVNRFSHHGPKSLTMLERESRVLEILKNEGYI